MGDPTSGMWPFCLVCVPFFHQGEQLLEVTSRVDKWHILGPQSRVSIAFLVELFLAVVMEIWNRGCGPFRPNFAFFAIQGQFRNTMSPCCKLPGWREGVIPVAYDQGSNSAKYHCWSFGIPGFIQLLVRAIMPNYAPHAAFCPPFVTITSENSKQPVRKQAQPRCTGPQGISMSVNQRLA